MKHKKLHFFIITSILLFYLFGLSNAYSSTDLSKKFIQIGDGNETLVFKKKIIPSEPIEIYKIRRYEKLFILQGSSSLHLMNSNGKLKKQIGQKGEGPGDFRLLVDFCISKDKIYAVDWDGTLTCFNIDGQLIKTFKLGNKHIDQIFLINSKIFYVYDKWAKPLKREIRVFKTLMCDNVEIFSIKDTSKQNPYHPGTKGKYRLPWFPSPFYNRPIFIVTNQNRLSIFFSRESYYYLYEKNRLTKKKFQFAFDNISINKNDKNHFFTSVESSSKRKFAFKTKNSVIFPKTKEYFFGATSWDDNFALISNNNITVISKNGEIVKKISYPDNKKYDSLSDFGGLPENIFVKYQDNIYFVNEEFEVEIYQIK